LFIVFLVFVAFIELLSVNGIQFFNRQLFPQPNEPKKLNKPNEPMSLEPFLKLLTRLFYGGLWFPSLYKLLYILIYLALSLKYGY